MSKKKIKDFTYEDFRKVCISHNEECDNCPLQVKGRFSSYCYMMIPKELLDDEEVEVDE